MLYGIDVSANQGEIDWDRVAATGKVDFVFARAIHRSEKDPSGEDSMFARNHDECRRLKIPFGAYLFYVPQEDPISQADQFCDFAKGRYGDLLPMVDVEDNANQKWAKLVDERKSALEAALHKIESCIGSPIIYTNPSTWREQFDNTPAFARYRLWVADYPQAAAMPKWVLGWPGWTIHQYASERSFLSGVAGTLDFDCLNGDDLALIRLV